MFLEMEIYFKDLHQFHASTKLTTIIGIPASTMLNFEKHKTLYHAKLSENSFHFSAVTARILN